MSARQLRILVQRLALHVLSEVSVSPTEPERATAQDGVARVLLAVLPPDSGEADDEAALGKPVLKMFFSPLELMILRAIGPDGTVKQVTLAARTGRHDANKQATSELREVLKNLVNRGVLDHGDDGYSWSEMLVSSARILGLNDPAD